MSDEQKISLQSAEQSLSWLDKNFKRLVYGAIALMAVPVISYIIRFVLTMDTNVSKDPQIWGTFGDFMGGTINPIFAFASFIALLWTIKQQNQAILISARELEYTRDELKASKEALEKSAEAQVENTEVAKQQKEALKLQQFESTFYSLLEQHNSIYEQMLTEVGHKGLDEYDSIESNKVRILNNRKLCRHFMVLYQLLKYVANNHPDNEKREFTVDYLLKEPSDRERKYASIIRACLDHQTLLSLAANCFCAEGKYDKFYKYYLLIERYRMLEHLPIDENRWQSTLLFPENDSLHLDILLNYNKAFGEAKRGIGKMLDKVLAEPAKSTHANYLNYIDVSSGCYLDELQKSCLLKEWHRMRYQFVALNPSN